MVQVGEILIRQQHILGKKKKTSEMCAQQHGWSWGLYLQRPRRVYQVRFLNPTYNHDSTCNFNLLKKVVQNTLNYSMKLSGAF